MVAAGYRRVRWWLLLLLVPHAGAEVLYGIDAGELVLSPDPDDPRAVAEADPGQAGTDKVVWAMQSAAREAVRLNGTLNATAVFDSSTGGASVAVSMVLSANGTEIARGAAKNVTVIGDLQTVRWVLPVDVDVPAGPLWWNITADGPVFVGLQLRLDGGTNLSLPVHVPPPLPQQRSVDLLPGSVVIDETGDGSDVVTTYAWPHNDTGLDMAWNVTVEAGEVVLVVLDGAGEAVFSQRWAAAAVGEAVHNGTAGDWSIVVQRVGFVGTLHWEAELRPEDAPAPRARSTPMPWVTVLVALLVTRSPRSRVSRDLG